MKAKGMSKRDAKIYKKSLEEIRKKLIGEIEHLENNNLKNQPGRLAEIFLGTAFTWLM